MTNNTDTPLTDKAIINRERDWIIGSVVTAGFARALESKLTQANERIKEMESLLLEVKKSHIGWQLKEKINRAIFK